MKTIYKYIKKNFLIIILIGIFIILQSYFELSLPDYMGKIQKLSFSMAKNNASRKEIINEILIIGSHMIFIAFLIFLTGLSHQFLETYLGSSIAKKLRSDVFHKSINLKTDTFNKFGVPTLLTRTTNDIEQIKNLIIFGVRIIFKTPIFLIIGVIKIYNKNVLYLSVLLITMFFLTLSLIVVVKNTANKFKLIQENTDEMNLVVREKLKGVRVIRSFVQQEKINYKISDVCNRTYNLIISIGKRMSFIDPVINISFDLSYVFIYALGFYLLNGKNITELNYSISEISIISQYTMFILSNYLAVGFLISVLSQSIGSIKRVDELLTFENKEHEDDNNIIYKKISNNIHSEIEFRNVGYIYPDAKKPTIKNISFKTKPGSITAIIGSTGSGKSTVINLIPRFFDSSEGEIYFNGENINNLNVNELRNKISFIPQKSMLFKGSIRFNMHFANETASDEEINKALKTAQAYDFIYDKKDGLDSEVSQGAKNYSGGQKQRLTIARGILKKAEVYIFDDSFSALDFKTESKIRSELRKELKDSAIIIIAQRITSIIDADNIIVLDKGECVAQGNHEYLMKNSKEYREIVNSQLDEEDIEKTIFLSKGNNI